MFSASMSTSNGNLILIAFRIECESIFNRFKKKKMQDAKEDGSKCKYTLIFSLLCTAANELVSRCA